MFYKYRVRWFYEEEVIVNYGIGKAENFKTAMEQVTNMYGEQEIIEVNFEWISDEDILEIEELYNAYKNEDVKAPQSEVWEEVVETLNEAVMEEKEAND